MSLRLNNGIDNYIGNGHTDENCISFACYGSIGEVFYQDQKVWVSDNANERCHYANWSEGQDVHDKHGKKSSVNGIRQI